MQLSQEQKNQIARIAKRFHLKLVLIFGSQIQGKTHSQSDLDIGVFVKKELSWKELSSLLEKLGQIFQKKIDVAFLNKADPLFLWRIMQKCILIYGEKRDLDELKRKAFHQFCDFKPYFRLEEKTAFKFIKNLSYVR